MEVIRELIIKAFTVDSIWSIVLRGVIWFALAIIVIVSADVSRPERAATNLRANLGFFITFLALSGGLIYLLFGFYQPA
jgi:hypothetical protein